MVILLGGLGDSDSSRDGGFFLFPLGFEPINALVVWIHFTVGVTSRTGRFRGKEGESEKYWDRSPNMEPYKTITRHTVCPSTQKKIAAHQQTRGTQGDKCTEHGCPLNTVQGGSRRG